MVATNIANKTAELVNNPEVGYFNDFLIIGAITHFFHRAVDSGLERDKSCNREYRKCS